MWCKNKKIWCANHHPLFLDRYLLGVERFRVLVLCYFEYNFGFTVRFHVLRNRMVVGVGEKLVLGVFVFRFWIVGSEY